MGWQVRSRHPSQPGTHAIPPARKHPVPSGPQKMRVAEPGGAGGRSRGAEREAGSRAPEATPSGLRRPRPRPLSAAAGSGAGEGAARGWRVEPTPGPGPRRCGNGADGSPHPELLLPHLAAALAHLAQATAGAGHAADVERREGAAAEDVLQHLARQLHQAAGARRLGCGLFGQRRHHLHSAVPRYRRHLVRVPEGPLRERARAGVMGSSRNPATPTRGRVSVASRPTPGQAYWDQGCGEGSPGPDYPNSISKKKN